MSKPLIPARTDASADADGTEPVRWRFLSLAHKAWLICAALALLIFLAAIPLGYVQRFSGTFGVPIDAPGWYIAAISVAYAAASMLTALVCLALAALLFWKRRQEPMTLFVSFFLLVYGIVLAGPLEALNGLPLVSAAPPSHRSVVISADAILQIQSALFAVMPLLFYLFPNGRFVPGWTRYPALLVLLLVPVVIRTFSVDWPSTVTLFTWCYVALLGVGIYAQIYRYRRVATHVERQQTKWVVFGVVLTFVILTVLQIPYIAATSMPAGVAHPWWQPLAGLGWWLSIMILPLSLAIAVMRYRLWDIDIIISRTLVYGALTASVVSLYVLIVGGLSIGLRTQKTLPGVIIALLVIAFVFPPLRQRLQRIADRFVPAPQTAFSLEQREYRPTTPEGQGAADTILRGRWLIIARVTWAVLAILTVGLFLAAIPGYASEIRDYVQAGRDAVAPALDIVLYVSGSLASIASVLLCLVLALILVQRKPSERMAVFVSCYLLLFGAALSGSLERLGVAIEKTLIVWPAWAVQASASAKPLLFATPTIALLALFPSGRFVPRWTRWLTLFSVLLVAAIFYLPPWWWPNIGNPIAGGTAVLWAAILFAALYAQIYRYRRISDSTERQQTKWVVFGFFVWFLLVATVSGSYATTYGSSPASLHPWWAPVVRAVWFLSATILPISLTIAVMRYRLFDIDLLINRSVVYLSLTAIVVGIYVVMVGYLGVVFQTRNSLVISLIATGLVAVVFQPLRQRLQRGINRMMYGERDDPYGVLSRLGQRLEAAYAPESVLPTIVETVAQTLKLPYVAIVLNQDGDFKIAAEFGRSKNEPITLPLIYQGEPVGELVLAPRAPGEHFTAAERQLLSDLARQAGVAAHAVRLTADLQRSRERLVLAREEERRRLRRDLHDGLGPQLAGLTLKLEAARNRLADDPLADSLLADLAKRTQDATADIRRLVYELRPPTLDELGLVFALREAAAQYSQQGLNGVDISFDAPESLPPLPAAVEVAVYRIAQEALTNTLRHAGARTCLIRLGLDETAGLLCLEVQDDGKGMPMERRAGVGLNSMRERAEELGGTWMIESVPAGGTRILVRLPIRLPDQPASTISEEP